MSIKRLFYPLTLLKYEGTLIVGAAKRHPEVIARLETDYVTETETRLGTLSGDVTDEAHDKGKLGVLTKEQEQRLVDLQHYMGLARKTARLAFPGQDVKLRQEFQVGVKQKHDLPDVLQRADIIYASLLNADNRPTLKAKGWADTDSKAFETARGAFGTPEEEQEKMKAVVRAASNVKHSDALAIDERVRTIQNAANLQFPATDPANASARMEFRLGIFPPDHHHSTDEHPAPTPAPTPTPPNP